jgi:exopolysaccharide production protein ExoY
MHTVDASADPSVTLMELPASNRRACPNSALNGDSQANSPRLGNRSTAYHRPRFAFQGKTKTPADTGTGFTAGASNIPSWKRILDVSCILLALPLWLFLFILIALWIKIVSRGPVFFRQERVGYRGNQFMILKFRTMKSNVETAIHERHLEQLIQTDRPMTKLDASGDPRIIRGGRLLRATGLDELPQLFNVLRGEMSLVGPRPCTFNEFRRYQPWQQERANAAPGLTGYWQVNGKNKTTFTEMINLDVFYTKNLSLRLDLAIMLRTVPAIVSQVLETRRAAGSAQRKDGSAVGQ